MQKIITVPSFGDEVEEVEISQWFVKEGERVSVDTPLIEVLVDKAVMEIDSEDVGRVVKILKEDGSIVKVGEDILILEI